MLSQTEDIFDYRDDGTEPLTPVSHILQNAQIEITLTDEGKFLSAVPVSKGDESTIIPATEESAGRTSRPEPHPLCDQLAYLAPSDDKKHEAYLALLTAWAESPYSHPLVRAVLTYVRSGTILSDLERERIIVRNADGSLGSGKLAGTDYAKCLVRWRMIPAPDEEKSESYRNPALFEKWASFYNDLRVGQPHGICQISGEEDVLCQSHPKGTLSSAYGAKLISANDSANFTYRGRFATPEAAVSVGYTASRMAHSALRWLATNHGKQSGDRIFLCWNPEGKETPGNLLYAFDAGEDKRDFVSYREELRKTLDGYGNKLRPQDDVVIAALEAATTGRLSVTYYTEMKSADLLDRIEHWYDTCAWDGGKYNVPTPSFWEIILCAFGKPSGNGLSLDKRDAKLAGKYFQKLLSCLTEGRSIPPDLVRALAARADTPQAYEAGPLARIRHTADGVRLAGREGLWTPFPVEYKRGQPPDGDWDALQLCGQAMCLEEMLCCDIREGALFYGQTRRRVPVSLSDTLRERVRAALEEMHALYRRGHTPLVKHSKGCGACSLKALCLPALTRAGSAARYLAEAIGGESEP